MSKQPLQYDASAGQPRRGRAIGLTIAISALIAACVAGIDDERDVAFRDGCDGVEEYLDEDGHIVYCVYNEDDGGGGDDGAGDEIGDDGIGDDGGGDDGGGDGGGDPCWQFPWLCESGGDEGGGEAGGEAGGGDGGGDPGDDDAQTCTRAGNDCTDLKPCCGSNVCGYGGERENTWCQPLQPKAWKDSCVHPRYGAAVYRNGTVCFHTNDMQTDSLCLSIESQSCVIGYHGECGDGTYTIHLRDLVQVPREYCKP